MSGGSMDYLCFKVEEAADMLAHEKSPSRRAFSEHLKKVAHALHEIEWVDSGDSSSPCDINAIRQVFENDYGQREMAVLIGDAKSLIRQMQNFMEKRQCRLKRNSVTATPCMVSNANTRPTIGK